MKHDIDLVMWDLDGTLLDTKPGIIKAIREALELGQWRELTEDELCTFIGPPLETSFPRYFGDDKQDLREFLDTFRYIYKHKTLYNAEPFDGIVEVMDKLKKQGKKQALCTYKVKSYAENLMKHYELDKYLDCIYGSSSTEKIYKSDMIINSARDLNIHDMKRTMLVGDTRYDFAAAILANSYFVAANYGYGDKLFKDTELGGTMIGHANTDYEILEFIK